MDRLLSVVLGIYLLGCASGAAEEKTAKHEPFLDACENCDWVFEGMPATLAASARIAPANEPGTPMQIDGVVRDRRTGADGHYRFDTIRPAGYPNTDIPEHVHMILIEVGCCAYWIDDIRFDDDPRLTREARGRPDDDRAGNGIAVPTRDASGAWHVTRDLNLGENIPNYPKKHDG